MQILKKIFSKKPVVVWGVAFFDVKENKDVTHNVTNIHIDSISSIVQITIEKGIKVDVVKISIEQAQKIGFINIKSLEMYCK